MSIIGHSKITFQKRDSDGKTHVPFSRSFSPSLSNRVMRDARPGSSSCGNLQRVLQSFAGCHFIACNSSVMWQTSQWLAMPRSFFIFSVQSQGLLTLSEKKYNEWKNSCFPATSSTSNLKDATFAYKVRSEFPIFCFSDPLLLPPSRTVIAIIVRICQDTFPLCSWPSASERRQCD